MREAVRGDFFDQVVHREAFDEHFHNDGIEAGGDDGRGGIGGGVGAGARYESTSTGITNDFVSVHSREACGGRLPQGVF